MSYYFQGDLCQLALQRRLLLDYGYDVEMSDVYPTLKTEEEFKRALSLIWTMRCEGWWHYDDSYFKYNICTPYRFWSRLGKDNDVKLYHFVDRKDIWEGKVKLNGVNIKEEDTVVKYGDVINIEDKEIVVE